MGSYTLEGRAELISCPTLVTEGEGDFASQSPRLFDALTCEKVLHQSPRLMVPEGTVKAWGRLCGAI